MVFASVIFLFFFFPIFLAGYFLCLSPNLLGGRSSGWLKWANAWLFAASMLFYFWGEGWLIWVMVLTSVIDFAAGLLISGAYLPGPIRQLEPGGKRSWLQKFGLLFSLTSNLGLLAYFKYFNFGVENARWLAGWCGWDASLWGEIPTVALPLGISFYTFQTMSYTIDVYRGHVAATRNVVDFACYVTMFPQLVAGPIVRYEDVARELTQRTIRLDDFAIGVQRFAVGLAKKVLLANTLAGPVDRIFALPVDALSPSAAWLGVVGYTLQIYFDFSGYSDMAIGMGKMLGFTFLENFRYPYAALSVQDFWRRWHISLSSWFRDYLYIPLGGNRTSGLYTVRNLLIVFLLCGLWHGAQWTFIAWGLFHGMFLALERTPWGRWQQQWPTAIRSAYTLGVVMLGWVLFRADSLHHAGRVVRALAGDSPTVELWPPVDSYLETKFLLALVLGAVVSLPVVPWCQALVKDLLRRTEGRAAHWWEILGGAARLAGTAAALAFSSFALAAGTYNPFIYYRF